MTIQKSQDHALLEGQEGWCSDLARSIRIWKEFYHGFNAFRQEKNVITFFGSARFPEDNPYYVLARKTAQIMGQAGYTIMTGGGPGIMEAANRGARDVKARSLGCSIRLPKEQTSNPYLDLDVNFYYFFVRKTMLVKYSRAFVLFPGGFGTMDEVFETLTLIQTRKIENFPLIAMGRTYWDNLMPFLEKTMLAYQTINHDDLALLKITDDPEEALSYL